MAVPYPGLGNILKMKITGTFTTVAQRVSVEGPDAEMGTRDVTHLDSTMKAKKVTLPDPGKLSLKLFYDPGDSVHALMRARVYTAASAVDSFQLVFNDSLGSHAADSFTGYVTKFTPNGMEVDNTLGADVEITLDGGAYTFTAGS